MRASFAVLSLLVVLGLTAAPPASAASAKWRTCGKSAGKTAAQAAGVPRAMDADARLQEIFGDGGKPSEFMQFYRSFCADFDRDGDVDRAVRYACCTVSSPSPFAILRNDGGGAWTIAYSRLHDTIFRVIRRGSRLVLRSPRYSRRDANCCPSRLADRELRFTDGRWVGRVTVRRSRS